MTFFPPWFVLLGAEQCIFFFPNFFFLEQHNLKIFKQLSCYEQYILYILRKNVLHHGASVWIYIIFKSC